MGLTGRACGGCCGCPNWKVAVKNCGVNVVGASVTIGSDTETTNGSGQATFTSAPPGATGTITATGYCTKTFTVPADCSNLTVNIAATSVVYTFIPTICCQIGTGGCYATVAIPVTVTVTQTSGGTFTDSCVATSSAGCNITLPAPCAGSPNNVFDVVWTATGFDTVTTSVTVAPGACPTTATAGLTTPSDHFCYSGSDCLDAIPASVSVTINTWSPAVAVCAGPFSLAFSAADDCTTEYGGSTGTIFSCVIAGCPGANINLRVVITASAGCVPVASVIMTVTGPCFGGGGFGAVMPSVSGTVACPIAFTGDDGAGDTCTVS